MHRQASGAERHAIAQERHQSERLRNLGQLAGGIAHDFNNLLAAILSYSGFVADASADRPAVRSDAEQIEAAATRAGRLTRQLLIFSRQDSSCCAARRAVTGQGRDDCPPRKSTGGGDPRRRQGAQRRAGRHAPASVAGKRLPAQSQARPVKAALASGLPCD